MSNFAVIRLGKDSIADIKTIDALHESPATPLTFTVHCKQVPTELGAGDYAFFCFGSDNSQGTPTEWVRGVRALGSIVSKTGGPGYNDPWHVSVEIKVVLPQSVVRKDLLAHAPTAYFWCSGIPTIGIEANSQQTVQMIKVGEPDQNVSALAYSLAAHSPVFKSDTIRNYPDLEALFDYQPASPLALPTLISSAGGETEDSTITLAELVGRFQSDANASLLHVDQASAHRLASSLLSKRFLIATGLAGSGKTKLAQAFARWLSTPDGSYDVVPVGADWTGNENVLGYPNGLDNETYVSKPALDLVIHAKDYPDIPHFLILDEMNLSHVERYFADMLSVIESEEEIQLYDGANRQADGKPIPSSLELPKNLFIIGTVNVDETTYMFSPKVLDRANVIEFRMDASELENFLDNPAKPDLSQLDGKGALFGKVFVDAAKNPVAVPPDVKANYDAEMLLLFKALQAHGAEFGYRTAYEAARFIHFYKLLGNHPDGDTTWFTGAFDCVVFQKLLPKLHGSRVKLGPVLKKLWFLCVNDKAGRGTDALKAAEEAARSTDKKAEPSVLVPADAPYPLSAEKIGRMWRLLIENGFASFAEA
jgi:5-methylcytosine-specific restriction protein B